MQGGTQGGRVGFYCAVLAHTMWGFFPLYWPFLKPIPPLALVSHRILWSFALLCVVVPVLMAIGWEVSRQRFISILSSWRALGIYAAAAALLQVNWLAFIWAVNNGNVLQASLGYYVNPLLSVLLGVLVLGERLLKIQWIALAITTVGVCVMTIAGGGMPWASLAMATSFAMYGLMKKWTPLRSLSGLWVEASMLLLPAFFFLFWTNHLTETAGVPYNATRWGLLLGGGILTVAPLALFAVAAKSIPLSTVGVLQYIGPTLQFIVGVIVMGEPFGIGRMIGFGFVWIGSALYLISLSRSRNLSPSPSAAEDLAAESIASKIAEKNLETKAETTANLELEGA